MYALLCSDLNDKLPSFPSDEPGGKDITFKRVLLNNCQEALRELTSLGKRCRRLPLTKRWSGEIKKGWNFWAMILKLALWRRMLKPFVSSSILLLASRLKFMVRDVLDLRANNWVPRREEVKAKTITEIHSDAEKNLGLRPGATASIRNRPVSGGPMSPGPGGFPITRSGTGGLMPGMPGTRMMPGMDNDSWEVPRTRSMPRGDGSGSGGLMSGKTSALLQGSSTPARSSNPILGAEPVAQPSLPAKSVPVAVVSPVSEKPLTPASKLNPADLSRKTRALLEEYFIVRLLDEALQCVEELGSPSHHPEVVKEAISIALEKIPPCVEPVSKLIEYLFIKKVLTARDIGTGCLLYGALLDDIGIDLPKAPNNFGEITGKLILAGGLDFNVVKEVLKKMEDNMYQKFVFDAAIRIVSSNPSGQALLEAQASEVKACQSLL
ncbi:Eukaryotic translation initiation factor isoform 4G-2 [Hibiscus syriacus]|uniref:Eukaryotic translation initiation factor isoform 4G-2 n=1 Tax=Hibiscus syriacus TaxID=106335 RepID=A0A6A3CC76_HIBSY|nr:Eukaryotic translation initiation factor isoform 4G-2 [Hibiscus syriacus]